MEFIKAFILVSITWQFFWSIHQWWTPFLTLEHFNCFLFAVGDTSSIGSHTHLWLCPPFYSLIISRLLSLPVLMTTSFSLEPEPLVHTSISPSPFCPCSPSSPSVTWGDDDNCHAGMEGGTSGLLGAAAGNWCLEWKNVETLTCIGVTVLFNWYNWYLFHQYSTVNIWFLFKITK